MSKRERSASTGGGWSWYLTEMFVSRRLIGGKTSPRFNPLCPPPRPTEHLLNDQVAAQRNSSIFWSGSWRVRVLGGGGYISLEAWCMYDGNVASRNWLVSGYEATLLGCFLIHFWFWLKSTFFVYFNVFMLSLWPHLQKQANDTTLCLTNS